MQVIIIHSADWIFIVLDQLILKYYIYKVLDKKVKSNIEKDTQGGVSI